VRVSVISDFCFRERQFGELHFCGFFKHPNLD
jgi:hypothetical protein